MSDAPKRAGDSDVVRERQLHQQLTEAQIALESKPTPATRQLVDELRVALNALRAALAKGRHR